MPRLLPSLLLLACTAPALAQAPNNAPATTTLRTNARLVVVDVIVTDKNQNPIHNLKAADFTLLENNAPQTFKNFEEHIAPSSADALKLPPPQASARHLHQLQHRTCRRPPQHPSAQSALNTPIDNQAQVEQQINEYLSTAKPGTHIAVFGLTDKLVLLQGFTSNPEILKSVFQKNGNLRASPLLQDQVGGSGTQTTQADTVIGEMSQLSGDPSGTAETFALMKQFETQNLSFQGPLPSLACGIRHRSL